VFAALRLAVLRGVDVRLLLPSRPDHRIVYAASSLYAFEAVRAGVRCSATNRGSCIRKWC
jgi:cardiolipin synthase